MQVLDLIEDSWKANLNVIIGRAIYQRVMLRLSNLFYAKCAQSTTLVTYAPTPVSHCSACDLVAWNQWFRWQMMEWTLIFIDLSYGFLARQRI